MSERVKSSGSALSNKNELTFTGIIDSTPRIKGVGVNTLVSMVVVELPTNGENQAQNNYHMVRTTRRIGPRTATLVRAGTLIKGVEVVVQGNESRKPSSGRGPSQLICRAKSVHPA